MTNYSPNEQLKTVFEFSSKHVKIRNLERAHLDGSCSESLKEYRNSWLEPDHLRVQWGLSAQSNPQPLPLFSAGTYPLQYSCSVKEQHTYKINIQRKRKWPEIVQWLLEGASGDQYENLSIYYAFSIMKILSLSCT